MKYFFRFTLALFAVCTAYSTSQAIWWHHKDRGQAASCAPATAAACIPETKEYTTTRYRTVVSYVPEQVVTRVTTWVPAAAPPMAAAPAGCSGSRGSCFGSGAPAGCSGAPRASGCSGAGAGCSGAGSLWHVNGSSNGSEFSAPKLALLESRLDRLDAKITALTETVNSMQDPSKAQDKVNVPLPALPNVPASGGPTGSAKPIAAPTETDPLLAAARAYKAQQASLPKIPVVAAPVAPADESVTRK